MSPEWTSALAAVATFVVIMATAVAALVQLRHIRAANQLAGLMHFTSVFESDSTQSATRFIVTELPTKLCDPAFVRGLLETNTDRREHPELRVCDFLEQQGSYIKFGMIDSTQYIDLVGAYVVSMWEALGEVIALRRTARNSAVMYENFEYLASLCQRELTAPQKFPHRVPVLMDEVRWHELAARVKAQAGVE